VRSTLALGYARRAARRFCRALHCDTKGGQVGFRDFWSRLGGTSSTPSSAGSTQPARTAPRPAAPDAARSTAADSPTKIHSVPVQAVDKLAGTVLPDPQRVKWVLLQSETDVAARRFVSLAALGENRADEAREARGALRELLLADLPGTWPEHIDMLLDVMQSEARRVLPHETRLPMPDRAPAITTPQPAVAQPAVAPAVVAPAVAPPPVWSPAPEAPAAAPTVAPPFSSHASTPTDFELCTIPGSTTDDIDMALVREYVQSSSVRRPWSSFSGVPDVEVLRTLSAIDGPPGGERLTVLGALFFAKRPERLVVQSKVRFVEFPGTEVASSAPGENVAYRYTEELSGTIPRLIARMEGIHKQRLAPGVLADDGFRVEEIPAVPVFALREAMVNAVCHRDYSLVGANIQVRLFDDRLEVQSPGALPDPVTIDNIVDESYARNPRIADMLRDLGYVERHGLGIDNMIKSMADANLPAPKFSSTSSSFTVTLRFRVDDEADAEAWLAEIGADSLPTEQQKALAYARAMNEIRATDYQTLDSVEEADATEALRGLVRAGWLIQTGTGDEPAYELGARARSGPGRRPAGDPVPEALIEALPASQRRILDIVIRHGTIKASEVLTLSGLKDRRTVQRTLAALAERGLIVRKASSKTDPNATYELNQGVWDRQTD
jgi:predicted HTH transcriptional regulator